MRGWGLDLELPPADIPPAIHFVAGVFKERARFEPKRLVQLNAGRMRKGNAGEGIDEAAHAEGFEEARVEQASHPLPLRFGGDVDGNFDRPAIGRSFFEGAGIAIAEHLPFAFGNEPGIE